MIFRNSTMIRLIVIFLLLSSSIGKYQKLRHTFVVFKLTKLLTLQGETLHVNVNMNGESSEVTMLP